VRGYDCLSHLELLPEHRGGLELLKQLGNRWTLLTSIQTGRGNEQNEWTAKPSDHRSKNLRGEEPDLAHTVLV
jgi:hypothetical protein